MVGTKLRDFAPLPDLCLEEFVSKDNFYRHLEEKLDLSFVRKLQDLRCENVSGDVLRLV